LAKEYPAYFRQSKFVWNATAGEVSKPMSETVEKISPAIAKICRNIDRVFIKLLAIKIIPFKNKRHIYQK
jgi:hypothetical protein